MPALVHLADERDANKILNGGIKPGKYRTGIFCMPVLPNFYVSHQWLRELKRSGVKTYVGVYFKVPSSEIVFAGRYNEKHRKITLGEAIKEIMSMDDPLGYELIIDRKIEAGEIEKVRSLPQKIGWRYKPGSKGLKPCSCEYCIRGLIKANRIREKYDPPTVKDDYRTLFKKIRQTGNDLEVEELLGQISAKRRRSDPSELMFLLDKFNHFVNRALANTLSSFRHKNTKGLLVALLTHDNDEVRDASAESIIKIMGSEGIDFLKAFSADPVIQQVISDHETSD